MMSAGSVLASNARSLVVICGVMWRRGNQIMEGIVATSGPWRELLNFLPKLISHMEGINGNGGVSAIEVADSPDHFP